LVGLQATKQIHSLLLNTSIDGEDPSWAVCPIEILFDQINPSGEEQI
jgi:hypothetical protein